MESSIKAILGWIRAVDLGVNIPLWVTASCFLQALINVVASVGLLFFFFMITKPQAYFYCQWKQGVWLITSPHILKGPYVILQGLCFLPWSLSVLKCHLCCCTNKKVVLQPEDSLATQQLKYLKIIFISGSSALWNKNGLVQKVWLPIS